MDSFYTLFVIFVGGPLVWWWLRRSKVGPASTLKVVGRTALTRSSVIAVIEAGDRRFLIGASDQGISLLSEIDTTAPDVEPNISTDDMEPVVESLAVNPLGPRMSPLETLRAMTVRTPTHSRPAHARRR